jgi:ribosomal protein S18 acetylase RimI-like enzyme
MHNRLNFYTFSGSLSRFDEIVDFVCDNYKHTSKTIVSSYLRAAKCHFVVVDNATNNIVAYACIKRTSYEDYIELFRQHNIYNIADCIASLYEFDYLVVSKEFRHRHIATELTNNAIKYAAKQHVNIFATANQDFISSMCIKCCFIVKSTKNNITLLTNF